MPLERSNVCYIFDMVDMDIDMDMVDMDHLADLSRTSGIVTGSLYGLIALNSYIINQMFAKK